MFRSNEGKKEKKSEKYIFVWFAKGWKMERKKKKYIYIYIYIYMCVIIIIIIIYYFFL